MSRTSASVVMSVWQADEYHPLRHDNRLRLAVRKLRKRVEADPSRPAWIETLEDGYRLGATTLVV